MTKTYGEESPEFFENLEDEIKEAICNSLAVAGIESVIGTDKTEVWTVLGEDEPDNYDYESDEHSEVIERATQFLSNELLENLNDGFQSFMEQIELNDGYNSFWMKFCDLEQTSDIDELNDGLQNVLEEIG